jgi:hypothetical protein
LQREAFQPRATRRAGVMFITRRRAEGLIRVTYWRSTGGGVAFGTVSHPRKRRMIIFAINLRAVSATRAGGRQARRVA